jgi:hypothetical protein
MLGWSEGSRLGGLLLWKAMRGRGEAQLKESITCILAYGGRSNSWLYSGFLSISAVLKFAIALVVMPYVIPDSRNAGSESYACDKSMRFYTNVHRLSFPFKWAR